MANAMGSLPTTPTSDAAPLHTEVQTLRSVGIPTETLRVTAPTAVSPFGPVRKNQPKPPVSIPGPRKPTDQLPPRPAPPTQQLTARPLARDLYDAHHADLAFGAA